MMRKYCVVFLLCFTLFAYLVMPAAAAEVVRPNLEVLPKRDVYTDIAVALQDIPGATMDQYRKDESKTAPEFITAVEYGCNGSKENSGNYGLYVYVYNPSGKEIVSYRSTITLATSFSVQAETDIFSASVLDWKPMGLVTKSVSNKEGYEGTLYKFRVNMDYPEKMTQGKHRRYDIADVTLYYADGTKYAVDVGNALNCSDYANESTYTAEWKDIDTLELQVTPVVYRHMTDSTVNTQVNSVYFRVPEKYWQQVNGKDVYDLVEIKATWQQKRTTPVLVTIDQALYKEYLEREVIGKNISDISLRPERSLYCDLVYDKPFGSDTGTWWANGWYFNPYDNDVYHVDVSHRQNELQALYWMFYKTVDADKGLKGAKVTAQEVLDYYKNCSAEQRAAMLKDLEESDKNYDTRNGTIIKSSQIINLKGREVSGFQQWLEKRAGMTFTYNDITDVSYIQVVPEEQWDTLKVLPNGVLSQEYLISVEEIEGFREKMDEMAQYNKDNPLEKDRMVILHFSVTDYETHKTAIGTNATFGGRDGYPGQAYMAVEDVFLDFKIINMTYESDVARYTVPTVMTPMDIMPGLDPSPDIGDKVSFLWGSGKDKSWFDRLADWLDSMKEQLGRVVAIVLGLVLLVVCWPLITAVLRFLASILRGVGRGANRLMDAAKRRKNKHKKE